MGGWLLVENDTKYGPQSVFVYSGAFVALGVLASVLRCFTQLGGIEAIFGRMMRITGSEIYGTQYRAWSWPTKANWLLSIELIPLMLASLPLARHSDYNIASYLGFAALYAFLLAPAGLLVGLCVWSILVLPLLAVGSFLWRLMPGHRHNATLTFATAISLFLLGTLGFAVTLPLAVQYTGTSTSTRAAKHFQLVALLGFGAQTDQSRVAYPLLLWLARLFLVLMPAAVVVGVRARNRAMSGRPDAPE